MTTEIERLDSTVTRVTFHTDSQAALTSMQAQAARLNYEQRSSTHWRDPHADGFTLTLLTPDAPLGDERYLVIECVDDEPVRLRGHATHTGACSDACLIVRASGYQDGYHPGDHRERYAADWWAPGEPAYSVCIFDRETGQLADQGYAHLPVFQLITQVEGQVTDEQAQYLQQVTRLALEHLNLTGTVRVPRMATAEEVIRAQAHADTLGHVELDAHPEAVETATGLLVSASLWLPKAAEVTA